MTSPAAARIHETAVKAFDRLGETLGIDGRRFFTERGVPQAFQGLDLDYFGPVEAPHGEGTIVVPRAFYDADTGAGYFTNTGAGLLKLAIDADGKLYGPLDSLQQALDGKAELVGGGRNFGINDILRLLRLKHQYGLAIAAEDYALVKTALSRHQIMAPLPANLTAIAHELIAKLLRTAQDAAAAETELQQLGIREILSKG